MDRPPFAELVPCWRLEKNKGTRRKLDPVPTCSASERFSGTCSNELFEFQATAPFRKRSGTATRGSGIQHLFGRVFDHEQPNSLQPPPPCPSASITPETSKHSTTIHLPRGRFSLPIGRDLPIGVDPRS